MPSDASNPEKAADWFAAHVLGLAIGFIAAMAGAVIASLWGHGGAGTVLGFVLGQLAGELCQRELNKAE